MTNTTRTSPRKRPLSVSDTTDNAAVEQAKAERRRLGLQRLMSRNRLNPTDLARICGLQRPNLIYNHLNGRTASLSLDTVERIIARIPGATFDALSGIGERSNHQDAMAGPPWPIINVVHEACADVWWPASGFGMANTFGLPIPSPEFGCNAFGIVVKAPAAGGRYLEGSILVCRPPEIWQGRPPSGSSLNIRRDRGDQFEITVRELVHDHEIAWIWPDTVRREADKPLTLRLPLLDRITFGKGERLTVLGVVVAAWSLEPASFMA